MGGSIRTIQRAVCACGSKFKKFNEFGYQVPKCPRCGNYPELLNVRRYLPNDSGKGVHMDIRYDKKGNRIKSPWDAIAVMKNIDMEIERGVFDPNDYQSKVAIAKQTFKHFVEEKYLPAQRKRYERGELSPTMIKKKETYRKHLSFFDEYHMKMIGSGLIFEFYNSWTDKLRTRDLVTQELKSILNFALRLERIAVVPIFPSFKAAGKKDHKNFLLPDEQGKIIQNIENPLYQVMIKILSIYAMRPSEVRALKWKDLDFEKGVIIVRRHFSNGTNLIEGRKSNKDVHYLPMTNEFREVISFLPRSLVKNNFVFIGKNGGAVGERVLSRAWHKARKKAGIHYVELYEGTKHSRLSYLKSLGHSDEDLILLSGHTNIKTVQRYAQVHATEKFNRVKSLVEQ